MDDMFYMKNPWDTLAYLDPAMTLDDLDHGARLQDTQAFSRRFGHTSMRTYYAALNAFTPHFQVLGNVIKQHDALMERQYGIKYVPFDTPLFVKDEEILGAYSTDDTRTISSMLSLPDTQGRIESRHDWDLGEVLEEVANTVGDFFGVRTFEKVPEFAYRIPYGGRGGIAVPYTDNHGFIVRQ